jgi:hypothetical protein
MDAATRSSIPFQLPAKITDGFRMARGVIRIITVATANTDVSITHTLGRTPNVIMILDPGTTYVNWKRGTVAWNQHSVSAQFSAAGTFTIWVV